MLIIIKAMTGVCENKEGTFRGEAKELYSKTCNPLPTTLSNNKRKRKDNVNDQKFSNTQGHILLPPRAIKYINADKNYLKTISKHLMIAKHP